MTRPHSPTRTRPPDHRPPHPGTTGPPGRSPGDRGQVFPIVAVLLALAALLAAGVVEVALVVGRRAAATAAADGAALAGAAEGRDAARMVAEENGARLTSYREVDGDVVVTVRRQDIEATARARWTPGPAPSADP